MKEHEMAPEAVHKILNEKNQVTKHCILYISIKMSIPKRCNKMLRLAIYILFIFSSINKSQIIFNKNNAFF